MQIALVSLFPEMFAAVSDYGVTGRAVSEGIVAISHSNPRDYTVDRHRTVDDRPYGGGPGMLMKIDPLRQAIAAAREQVGDDARVIYLSPQGQRLDHGRAVALAEEPLPRMAQWACGVPFNPSHPRFRAGSHRQTGIPV